MTVARRFIAGCARHFVPGSGVWTFSCASSNRPTGEQKTAQGFSPGNDTHKEIALKGRPKWHWLQRIYILLHAMAI